MYRKYEICIVVDVKFSFIIKLQIINADLGTERNGRQNIRNGKTSLRLQKVQVIDEVEVYGSTTATITAKQHGHENSTKTNAEDTEHMKLFEEIVAFFVLSAKVFGMEAIFDWRWKKSALLWLSLIFLTIAWVCTTYTVYIHCRNNDYVRILEPLAISGLTISCTLKAFTAIIYWNETIALLFHFRSVCRRTTEGCSRATILTATFRKTLLFIKFYAFGVLSAVSFYLVVPIKVYFVDNELMPLMPVEIIFCDQSTMSGFLVANVVQAIIGLYAAFCSIYYGIVFISLILNYKLEADLLAEDFKDLDKMWTGEVKVSIEYRHAFLRNICIKRQDMNIYLDRVKLNYTTKLIFYFCFNYFSQIICMYETMINNWEGGYGPFCGLFFEMMFYCYMGTEISKVGDRLCFVIGDTKWYEYDSISQRVLLMLLHETQVPKDIQLGFIGPLNLVTFVTVVKSIYSYYTVLTEML